MINIEFVQLNIVCISEDTGIKVYKSEIQTYYFNTVMFS